ncbi:sulfatase-like hydrolase/transferase [Aureibaculum sp. 2210JD6-5]|uniref:sulfatase-like hydrolase/transferase n=1 Tax=Aureibaculum sp. 2210JD6-5 TaxID=3103957 RepID=UPI002AAC69E4|nr:sulfatase-like hydrolase/transferase [Aureibaculum sp. 2210JD6-5]MDY7395810.1 sulfatase-like hydrolase/transferase [Aureibaculum sp. 2210JD6-5]
MKHIFSSILVITLTLISCQSNKKDVTDKTEKNSKPNILFILVDDLGAMDLGYTGSTYHETPNIDKMASEGMVFTNAYASSPVCSPTRAAIMSGKNPVRLNLTDWIPGNGPQKDQKLVSQPFKLQLDLEEHTMAEAFKDAGYQTLFAGKWHLGEEEKYYPQFQGFDINTISLVNLLNYL